MVDKFEQFSVLKKPFDGSAETSAVLRYKKVYFFIHFTCLNADLFKLQFVDC
jgi:hypothetical protein